MRQTTKSPGEKIGQYSNLAKVAPKVLVAYITGSKISREPPCSSRFVLLGVTGPLTKLEGYPLGGVFNLSKSARGGAARAKCIVAAGLVVERQFGRGANVD